MPVMDIASLDDFGFSSNHEHIHYSLTSSFDLNQDGFIDINDCPYQFGTAMAKLWFHTVLIPSVKASITPEMKAKSGDDAVGVYQGKAIVPLKLGKSLGDMRLLIDRFQICDGFSKFKAEALATKVKLKLMEGGTDVHRDYAVRSV